MKKIALFGGTGRTGTAFLKQALEAGYQVKLLARTPSKLAGSHANREVIQGDVLDPKAVESTVVGCDIVISLFGHVKGSPPDVQTQGTQNIVDAMKKHGVNRIISLSGGGLPFPEKDKPKLPDHIIRTIMKIAVPKILNDAIAHAQVLKKSQLDWTIVRGPRLADGEKKGDYRIGWVGVNSGTKINRADLADFILKEIEAHDFPKSMPFVSY